MSLKNTYSFEIDFLPVGDGERSGDAIAMRYGYPEDFRVVVIDGGSKESGERLVDHVRRVYQARHINLVINTHPDADHASGLSVVLETFPVRELWMHQPWNHPAEAMPLFRSGRFTTVGLADRIREALDAAHTLESVAKRRGVQIREPYQGMQYGPWLVLSPTAEFYLSLLPHFDQTPAARFPSPLGVAGLPALGLRANGGALSAVGLRGGFLNSGIGALDLRRAPPVLPGGLLSQGLGGLQAPPRGTTLGVLAAGGLLPFTPPPARRTRNETWTTETLRDDRETSEQNESCVVLYGRFNGSSILLTGDAGKKGLTAAWFYATRCGIDLRQCSHYQVPHHGSRQNVSPQVLDLILGSRLPTLATSPRYAIASVAAGADDYPRKAVANGFLRRGVSISRTAGSTVSVCMGSFPNRGLQSAQQLPFYAVVDDPD